MDIFQTSFTAIQIIYVTTKFIKKTVIEYKSYDSNKADITDQLEHELVFLETFQKVCFVQSDPLLKKADISDLLKRDVDYSLLSLSRILAEYRIEALRYILPSDEQSIIAGEEDLDVDHEASDANRSLKDQFKSKYKNVKEGGTKLQWALFGGKKILELLKGYRLWTNRLRETFQLITGVYNLSTSVHSPFAENLGVARARERQIQATKPPPANYGPLDGTLSGLKPDLGADGLSVGVYESEDGFDAKEVIVDIRSYDELLLNAYEGKQLYEIKALKEPVRQLSWLLQSLHQLPSPERDVESDYGLHTLSCIGYLDHPESNRALLLYQRPSDHASNGPPMSLHDLINKDEVKFKPGLGARFRVAHALAASVLATHSSGWVHKNICSRGILVLPNRTHHGEVDPYLLGWGTSRPVQADTNLSAVFEFEPNLHHHKDRFGQPNSKFTREHDIYSLGILLLEIGLWKTMSSIFAKQIQKQPTVDVKKQASTFQKVNGYVMDKIESLELLQKMGAGYAGIIRTCLTWPSGESEGDVGDLAIDFRKTVVDALVLGCKL
jgi:hypothetical protein